MIPAICSLRAFFAPSSRLVRRYVADVVTIRPRMIRPTVAAMRVSMSVHP
jgi:hypothetical protein